MRVAVLNDYQNVALSLADWQSLGREVEVKSFTRAFSSKSEAAQALRGFDVLCLMRERMTVDAALIAQLPSLKLITITGSRMRCVDLAAASRRGISVCMSGGGDASSTVEHAVALIMAAAKRIPQEDRNLRAGGWQEGISFLLEGRTLGILGLGRIGSAVANVFKALGMNIIAWSPNLTLERSAEHGVGFLPRERFFAEADVISIHMVLSERSRGIVGASELALMKRTALLVNTSRGPLVNECALIDALQERRIACAALDVFDVEPLERNHPFTKLNNTVLTPHMGFVNDRSYATYYVNTVETIRAWRDGSPIGLQNP